MNNSSECILNLEWAAKPYRDRVMSTLVSNYLRHQGYNVVEKSIFQARESLKSYRPKVLFKSGYSGSKKNHEVIKYCHLNNLPMIMFTAEGNALDNFWENYDAYWGWNKDKKLLENVKLMWSSRTKNIVQKHMNNRDFAKIKVTGGIQFDAYRIQKFKSKYDFLRKYNKSDFQIVIGIGLWNFGLFDPKDHRYELLLSIFGDKQVNRFKSDQLAFNEVLKTAVQKFPHVLFLLKRHPGITGGLAAEGIEGLDQCLNTLILKEEEEIGDCINISDLWFVYESTTALEAWLLSKETALINPSGTDFDRMNIYRGSPNYSSGDQLIDAISQFLQCKSIPGFQELAKERDVIISDSIGWADGLNHVRAGNEIIKLYNSISPVTENRFYFDIEAIREWIKWHIFGRLRFVKYFQRYVKHRDDFSQEELERVTKDFNLKQLEFYKSLKLSKDDLLNL